MNIFDFENKVRSAFNNQHHNLDMDRLLSDLNLGNESSKRRVGFLPYIGVMAVALTGILMYVTYSVQNDDMAMLASDENTATEVKSSISSNQTKEVKVLGNKNNNTIFEAQKIKITTNEKNKSLDATNNRVKPKISLAKVATVFSTTSNAMTKSTIETIPSTNSVNEQNINQITTEQSNIAVDKTNKVIASAVDQKQISAADKTDLRTKSEAVTELPRLHLNMLLVDEDIEDINFRTLNKKVSDCPKFSEGNWNLAIVPEAGILVPIKSLGLKDDNFSDIFNTRKRNESSQLSFQTGIGIQFRNKITGLYIKPGFNYSIINETFTNEDTRFVTNEVQYQLHQFNIPIAIGTSLEQDKFSIDLEGGINFNFLQKTNGQLYNGGNILNGDDDFIMLDDDQSFFKESIGLGFFAGTALKTQLNTRSEIFLGARFYFNTLSNSSNQNPIDQRYSFVGVHAGVIYTLF